MLEIKRKENAMEPDKVEPDMYEHSCICGNWLWVITEAGIQCPDCEELIPYAEIDQILPKTEAKP